MQEHIDRRDKKEKKRIRQLEKEIKAIEGDTKSERLVTVILYTLPEKKDGAKGPKEEQLDKEDTARFRKYLNKRWRGLHQFSKGQLTVKGGSDEYWNGIEKNPSERAMMAGRNCFRSV